MDLLPEARAYALDMLLTTSSPALAARLHACGLHTFALTPTLAHTGQQPASSGEAILPHASATEDAHAVLHSASSGGRAAARLLHRFACIEATLLSAPSYADMIRIVLTSMEMEPVSGGGVSSAPPTDMTDISVPSPSPLAERVVEEAVMRVGRQYVLLRLALAGLFSAQVRSVHKCVKHALTLRGSATGAAPLRSAMREPKTGRGGTVSVQSSPASVAVPGEDDAPTRAHSPTAARTRAREESDASPAGSAAVSRVGTGSDAATSSAAHTSATVFVNDGTPAATRTQSIVSMHTLHLGPALGTPALSRFNLTDYDWLGFDLDHTLVTYKQAEFNKHMFYAAVRQMMEGGARAAEAAMKVGGDLASALTTLTDAARWSLFATVALLRFTDGSVASSPSHTDASHSPTAAGASAAPLPAAASAQARAMAHVSMDDLRRVAAFVGDSTALATNVANVPFTPSFARVYVIIDCLLANILLLDCAAAVMHATHAGEAFTTARIAAVYGDGPLEGYTYGDTLTAVPRAPSMIGMPVSSGGTPASAARRVPSSRTMDAAGEEAAPPRVHRRYGTIHTGFDECLPALVTTVAAAVDALLHPSSLAGASSTNFDYSGVCDVCIESVRACFSSYCTYGFAAITQDLPRFVDPQPIAKTFLTSLRRLPLPPRTSSRAGTSGAGTYRMQTARTLSSHASATSSAGGGQREAPHAPPRIAHTRRMRTFMLTNAAWEHTNAVMTYAYGAGWTDLFDMIVTSAGKKNFFRPPATDSAPANRLTVHSARVSFTPGAAAEDTAATARPSARAPASHPMHTVSSAQLRAVDTKSGRVIPVRVGAALSEARSSTRTSTRVGTQGEEVWGMRSSARAEGPTRTDAAVTDDLPSPAIDITAHKVYSGGNVRALMAVLNAYRYAAHAFDGGEVEGEAVDGDDGGGGDDDEDASVAYMGDHILHDVVGATYAGWHAVAVIAHMRALARSADVAAVRSERDVTLTESASSTSVAHVHAPAPVAHSRTSSHMRLNSSAAPNDAQLLACGPTHTRVALCIGQAMRSAALAVPSVEFLASILTSQMQSATRFADTNGVGRMSLMATHISAVTAQAAAAARSAVAASGAAPSAGRRSSGGLLGWLGFGGAASTSVDPTTFHTTMGRTVRSGRVTVWHLCRAWGLAPPSRVIRACLDVHAPAATTAVPRASLTRMHLHASTVVPIDAVNGGDAARRPSAMAAASSEADMWDALWKSMHASYRVDEAGPAAHSHALLSTTLHSASASMNSLPVPRRGRSPSAASRTSRNSEDAGAARSSGGRSGSPASTGSGAHKDDDSGASGVGCLPWLFKPTAASHTVPSQERGGPLTSTPPPGGSTTASAATSGSARSLLAFVTPTIGSAVTPRATVMDRGLTVGGAFTSCQRTTHELSRSRSWFVPIATVGGTTASTSAATVDAIILETAIMCGGPRDTSAWAAGVAVQGQDDNVSTRRLLADTGSTSACAMPEMWRLLACRAVSVDAAAPVPAGKLL